MLNWNCIANGDRLGLTKTGQGSRIESFYRAVPSFVVPGRSLMSKLAKDNADFSRWLGRCIG
jgi:hypothetical protein